MLQVIRDMTGPGRRRGAGHRYSWTARAVLDELDFGSQVGGELEIATTLCHEVRASHEPVVIDKASDDPPLPAPHLQALPL